MTTTARVWRSAVAACAVLALAACGGGGGGGGGETAAPEPPPAPAPAPTAATPLAITSTNMGDVAAYAPGWSENVLQIGELAANYANRFRASATPITETCPNGGVVTLTLSDSDGNTKLSAGDRVVAELKDCGVPLWNAVLAGTFTVDVTASGDSPRSVRGTASMGGSGLTLSSSSGGVSTVVIKLFGSVGFEWSKTDAATTIAVASTSADDLRITGAGNGQTVTERVRAIDVSKTLQYDEARVKLRVALRYDSEVLGGSVTVSTPKTVQAYLDTYPEQGEIDIKGAGGVSLHLTPNFVTNSDYVNVGLDSNGDEQVDTTVLMPWQNLAYGYLWWNGRSTLAWGYSPYYTQSYSSTAFTYSMSSTQSTGVLDPLWLQFSRPPVDLPALSYRFRDGGSTQTYDYTYVNVDADTTVQGAVVVIKPRTPLRHGRYYTVEMSTDGGASWNNALTVHDALGNSLYLYGGTSITTANTMHANVAASGTVLPYASTVLQLDGSASTSARPIASWRWRQLNGTPLALSAPDAAVTQVQWGASAPTGLEPIVLELTITDVAGEQETARVTVNAVSTNGGGPVLYFRSAAGDYIGGGQTVIVSADTGAFGAAPANSGYVSFSYSDYASWWYLNLASADNTPLHVGAYENAVRAPFHDRNNGLELTGSGRGCNTISGRFDVLEIATDSSGTITKLAVDFEQHCEGPAAPPLLGSFRLNSSIPLRL